MDSIPIGARVRYIGKDGPDDLNFVDGHEGNGRYRIVPVDGGTARVVDGDDLMQIIDITVIHDDK